MSHKPKHCLSSETATATDVDAGSTSEHNGDTQVNVSNANTNNQQHGRKEAPLMSRDHKRHIAQATTDSSSQCNQQQQHHIVTCSEMRDVWINEIGPKLDVIDIVRLSMVNQWARHIAHNIKQHNGYSTVTSVAKYREGVVCWPDLRWELALNGWYYDHTNHTADRKWCAVVSLRLEYCNVSDVSFVRPRRLEKFAFTGDRDSLFDASPISFVASMLMSCTRLVSLSLDNCIDDGDSVKWLVNVLAHHTQLTHLTLWGNQFGATRMKQLCGVLCHMSHITLLNLADKRQRRSKSFIVDVCVYERKHMDGTRNGSIIQNYFGDEGVKCVCDCIDNMPNINALYLSRNKIGPNGAKHVCAALANKHQMTELDLHYNELGSDGVRHLLPCLAQLSKLSMLLMIENGVDDETARQAQRQLPHVECLSL